MSLVRDWSSFIPVLTTCLVGACGSPDGTPDAGSLDGGDAVGVDAGSAPDAGPGPNYLWTVSIGAETGNVGIQALAAGHDQDAYAIVTGWGSYDFGAAGTFETSDRNMFLLVHVTSAGVVDWVRRLTDGIRPGPLAASPGGVVLAVAVDGRVDLDPTDGVDAPWPPQTTISDERVFLWFSASGDYVRHTEGGATILKEAKSGGFLAVGGAGIQRFSAAGELLWERSWRAAGSVGTRDILEADDGSIVVPIGFSGDFNPNPNNAAHPHYFPGAVGPGLSGSGGTAFVTLSSEGEFVRSTLLPLPALTNQYALDGAGNLYVQGRYETPNTDLDPGEAILTLSRDEAPLQEVFVLSLASDGALRWARYMIQYAFYGGRTDPVVMDVTSTGDFLMGGSFHSTVNCALTRDDSIVHDSSRRGDQDAFLLRASGDGRTRWGVRFGAAREGDRINQLAVRGNRAFLAGAVGPGGDVHPSPLVEVRLPGNHAHAYLTAIEP